VDDFFASSRQGERRSDAVLGAVVDVAIAYRDNLGPRVAEAFMRETRVPDAVAQCVLNRTAHQRTSVPRRRLARAGGIRTPPDGT
jgi:hypothetical protein